MITKFSLLLTAILAAGVIVRAQNVFPSTGNVGIGTTTPLSKLSILDSTEPYNFQVTNGTVDMKTYSNASFGQFGTFSNHPFQLMANNGTNQLVLMPNGVVGIGNGNPTLAGLVVDKKVGATNAIFGSNTTGIAIESSYPIIGYNTYYNGGNKFIGNGYGAYAGLDPTNGLFYISNTTATGKKDSSASLNTRFAITAAGNVGIGTTTPSSKLSVYIKGTYGYTSQYTNGTIDLRTYLGNSLFGSYAQIGTFSDHPLRLNTYANYNQLDLEPSGLVGIGTNFPKKAGLTVNAKAGAVNAMFGDNTTGVAIESSYPGFGLNTYYNEGRKFIRNGYGGYIGLDPTSGLLGLYNTSASGSTDANVNLAGSLVLTAAGNVGIGTTSPANKLDVCGTIRAKEVVVQTGWCDYVFDKEYKLPSLNEVESYITQNKHLPDVPSATEVEGKGVQVAQMDSILIKKVEELTLYVINQNKQMQQLQQKIVQLESIEGDKKK